MPYARACQCPQPIIFEHGSCARCGHEHTHVTPSTKRIALAIAEVALGQRRLTDRGMKATPPH